MSVSIGQRVDWDGEQGTVVAVQPDPSATVDLDDGRRVTIPIAGLKPVSTGARIRSPRPPAELEAEMAAAHDDPVRLGIAHGKYEAWLADQGFPVPQRGRPARADKAAQ